MINVVLASTGGTHLVAIVRLEDQRLLATIAD